VLVFSAIRQDNVNRAREAIEGPSGKSVNVAKVLHALGAQVLETGFLGSGPRAEGQLQGLSELKVPCDFVRIGPPLRECVTVIDESTGQHTELVEESAAVEAPFYDQLFAKVQQHLPGRRALVISGSLTPGAPVDFYARCVRLAHSAGVMAVVDASGEALALAVAERPDLIKPNRSELSRTLGHPIETTEQMLSGMEEMRRWGARRVVVTQGPGPTLALDETGSWTVPTPAVPVKNPIGCGDAFTAGLTLSLVKGESLAAACAFAAEVAGRNARTLMPGELA
jgi:1-phosphofructokinase family hexose kinase